jgi:GT2 family glycosyltransferase/glycosyltransferase involved in cell wall biosynthesis
VITNSTPKAEVAPSVRDPSVVSGNRNTGPALGVVVLTYATRERCPATALSLVAHGIPASSILVVENSNQTPGRDNSGLPGLQVVRLDANYGYASGMNVGIRRHLNAGKRYVLLLTHDVELRDDTVSRMLAAAESNLDYGVFGPVVWWREANRVFSYGGVRQVDGSTTHVRDVQDARSSGQMLECDWVDGAAMLVRSDVFRCVGLFDERFFLYFEETEFCLRVQRAGWRIGVVSNAVIEQSPGGAARPGAYAFLLARNGLEHARRAAGAGGVLAALRREKAHWSDLVRKTAGRHSPLAVRRESATVLLASWLGTAAFALRVWGPPPRFVPGLGDVKNARRSRQKKTVVVSTFPPRRDGIARYADQFVDGLRKQGVEVRSIGFPGSRADLCLPLDRGLRTLRLLVNTSPEDSLVLMWHPEFFVSGRAWSRTGAYIALAVMARLRKTSIVIHEPDAGALRHRSGLRAAADALERKSRDWFWGSGAEICFHSKRERDDFVEAHLRGAVSARLVVREHGAFFRPYALAERTEARRKLSLPEELLLLCVGFIGRHKGFDRAVRAFAALPTGSATLRIVGSLLYETAEERAYVNELRELISRVEGARLEERFLDDKELDLWIQAADAVVAPYRSSASSGIVARARLFGTRVVATAVGGLSEQLGPDDILVTTDDELKDALSELVRADCTEVST